MCCLLWFIATLAYRCSKVSSFTFVICFASKVMHISLLLFSLFININIKLLIDLLVRVSSVWFITLFYCHVFWFGKHCHLQVHFGAAAYEIRNRAKLWHCTVWNIIYTGIFPLRASLLLNIILYNNKYLTIASCKPLEHLSVLIILVAR